MPYKDRHDLRFKLSRLRWYYRNKERHREILNIIARKKKEYLNKLKDRPGADCGIKYPYFVKYFDHRNKLEKKYNLGPTHEGWGRI